MLFFIQYSIFFSFKSCKQRQERRVESKVWGSEALHYYQRIKHHILWSGVIFRRGGTFKWGHQGYRGWLVSKWLRYEWKHSLHRKYQTRLVTCLWIIQHKRKRKEKSGDDKMLLMSPSCIWPFWSSKGLHRFDHSISNVLCNNYYRNERKQNVQCVFSSKRRKTSRFHLFLALLYQCPWRICS